MISPSAWSVPAVTACWDRKLAGHNSGGGNVDGREKRVLITITGNLAFLIAVRKNFNEERKPSCPTVSYITPSVFVATNTSATVMSLGGSDLPYCQTTTGSSLLGVRLPHSHLQRNREE
jgi:hypothetical protein